MMRIIDDDDRDNDRVIGMLTKAGEVTRLVLVRITLKKLMILLIIIMVESCRSEPWITNRTTISKMLVKNEWQKV